MQYPSARKIGQVPNYMGPLQEGVLCILFVRRVGQIRWSQNTRRKRIPILVCGILVGVSPQLTRGVGKFLVGVLGECLVGTDPRKMLGSGAWLTCVPELDPREP